MYDINREVHDPVGVIGALERDWDRTRFTLLLTPEQEKFYEDIGRKEELQNVPSNIPTVGIIGNYLYRMDPVDERFIEVIYDNPSGKDYKKLEYETDTHRFIYLLSGLSFVLNNRWV